MAHTLATRIGLDMVSGVIKFGLNKSVPGFFIEQDPMRHILWGETIL
jgi:hypothetical protein